jgi:hypothetical protein
MRPVATPAGAKSCCRCGKVKPLSAFYWLASRNYHMHACKVCHLIRRGEQDRARGGAIREHEARPEVRARLREQKAAHARTSKGRATAAAYRRSPLGKILHARRQARYKARHAADPVARARAEEKVARIDAELSRRDPGRYAARTP